MMGRAKRNLSNNKIVILYLIAVYVWLCLLFETDSYYSIYMLLGLLGLVGARIFKKIEIHLAVISTLFSLFVALSNYNIFDYGLKGTIKLFIVLMVGTFVFYDAVLAIRSIIWNIRKYLDNSMSSAKLIDALKTKYAIGIYAAILFLWYLLYLVFAGAPGNVATDTMNSFKQILNGQYSDHHPICYTLFLKFVYEVIGYFSKDLNITVIVLSICSLIVVSLVYGLVLETIAQIVHPYVSLVLLLWYMLHPVHIVYSISIWKDVPFSLMVTLWIVTFIRGMYCIGNKWGNFIFNVWGGIWICALRHNGKLAFIVLVIVLVFTSIKIVEIRRYVFASVLSLGIAIVLMNIGINSVNAEKVVSVDSLSIPLQQMSRVIVDGCEIDDESKMILSEFIDVDSIPDIYINYLSDPIKGAMYNGGNKEYFKTNTNDFVRVYFRLGLRHPIQYIKAWIDMTRGYWNGGYPDRKWVDSIAENELGIHKYIRFPVIKQLYSEAFQFISRSRLLQPLTGVGIHIWIVVASFIVFIKKRKYVEILALLPLICIWGTLLIACPLADLSYILSVFTSLPLVIGLMLKSTVVEA